MSVRCEHGDSRAVLPTLAADSIDACVTDPPYALTSTTKRWANTPLFAEPPYDATENMAKGYALAIDTLRQRFEARPDKSVGAREWYAGQGVVT